MGSLQSNRALYEQALEVYTAATRRNPDDALASLGKGTMLLLLHRPVEALAAYREAVRLAPTFALAYAGLWAWRSGNCGAIRPRWMPMIKRSGGILLCACLLWQGLGPAVSQALLAGAEGLSARAAPGAARLLTGMNERACPHLIFRQAAGLGCAVLRSCWSRFSFPRRSSGTWHETVIPEAADPGEPFLRGTRPSGLSLDAAAKVPGRHAAPERKQLS